MSSFFLGGKNMTDGPYNLQLFNASIPHTIIILPLQCNWRLAFTFCSLVQCNTDDVTEL